jgi:putative aldouronate transport system substrate-binding protein
MDVMEEEQRMKRNARIMLSVLMAMILILGAVGCGNTTPAAQSSVPAASSVAPAASSAETSSEAPAAESSNGPMTKYEPGITIKVIRVVDDTTKYLPGEDLENNSWSRLYADELGITLSYDWIASTASQYDEKLNVNIASGNVPDMLPVNRSQLARLAKTDLINKDLGWVYDDYAADLTKQIMTQEGTTALDSARFDGKLIAIPNTGSSMDSAPMLWLRQDWLDKLGLTAPKTADELLALIDAFTAQDPAGSGMKDYIGLGMMKDLYGGYAGIDGFCNMYGAYPNIWLDNGSGRLVKGNYQPEMRVALQKLQDLYKAGKIDKEFAVKDGGKASEMAVSDKNGIQFGQMWNPLWPLQANKDKNPSADWIAYPIPTAGNAPANPQISLGTASYYVVRAGYEHPEALMKMINMFIHKAWGSTTEDYQTYMNPTVDGVMYEAHKFPFAMAWPARKNLDIYHAIGDAFKANDTSKLNPEQLTNYTTIKTFKDGDNAGWGMARVFGELGSFKTMDHYVNNNLFKMNAFYGADTPTMTTKGSSIDKLEVETFTKIIMGAPIEEFDKFVQKAMDLGVRDMENEVNEWYQANR